MRVLLVEDGAMIGEAIQGALKDASYVADWVKNGQTVLTTAGAAFCFVALLDWPGNQGFKEYNKK